MAWIFGDGFDLYAAVTDPVQGYWDSGSGGGSLVAGRFGGQAFSNQGVAVYLTKASGSNDAMHHIAVAFKQTAALSGTTLGMYFQLLDGTTGQCCIVFRSDGAIVLTSGTPVGTALATYTGALTANNTWYAFEFEIVINNTTGSFTVRKNGSTSADFSATSLNTRGGTANNYANKLSVGQNLNVITQAIDDFLWRSDASSVAWVGDIRCYTRYPASDSSVQFSKSPATSTVSTLTTFSTAGVTNGTARYTSFAATYDGAIGSATVVLNAGYTGNLKCSIFAATATFAAGGVPTTVLGSATTITNPVTGSNTFTFGTPVSVTKGTPYYIGWDSDTTSGTFYVGASGTSVQSTTAYASFPVASPTTINASAVSSTVIITVGTNNSLVNETLQDTTTSYVYDSTAGHADFYGLATATATPASVVAVTTRGYLQKSDAGSRTAAIQLKSGATTVATTTIAPSTGFVWSWRTDTVDPNTSATWTHTNVNAVTIGPKVIS